MMQVSKLAGVISGRQVGIWLGLNLLDLGLSLIALEYGRANEFSILRFFLEKIGNTPSYYPSSYVWYGVYKMGLAMAVPILLAQIKKSHLLRWLNVCLVCVCLYIIVMLIRTFS
jgi:hypothetical protein